MVAIVLKIMICSSLLIAIYHLFLEKEKMYGFNRFYLLFSLVFSYTVPFVSITSSFQKPEKIAQLTIEETAQQMIMITSGQSSFDWMNMMWILYAAISIFLLVKSILAIRTIKKIEGERITYLNYHIVSTEKRISPFSFWNTIYLGKNYITNNVIDSRIFLHEKSHIDQKHSIDIAFIEVLKIFTWFNPVLFLYKKAMVTNHEFLADEAVLKNNFNVKSYQSLILDEIINSQNPTLTHSFNFNNTKKRFIMMTTKKSKFIVLKKAASVPVFIAAFMVFASKTYANNPIQANTETQPLQPSKKVLPQQITKVIYSSEKSIKNEEQNPVTVRLKENFKTTTDTLSPKKKTITEANEGRNTLTEKTLNSNDHTIEPQYPGGSQALRSKIANTMDVSKMKAFKGVIKSVAYIYIDENGKTTKVTTSGDNEIFNSELLKTLTVLGNEVTWTPGTQNGKAIAAVVKLPAALSF
ncbi:hypothetical protein MP477_05980 [Chryseobacterium sp. WG23]|uniref:M56 family metallopeptidase n=1 Tax=Chryseobacterium sp. WG23 TaxID=2926910 RepID=UPI00211EF3A2|nr:M56 family metallopeptidase [Chryseobacterium sp. WG23]MCQ9634501.1 hypothetical protein [Chryseobacterium sp. WG23]